ncbi:MAG TPA: DUF1269 domain-containing protein [Anaerolineae bacterium]|jgi:uncharacterized membrane protein|nr:DUF1269 domain-containing protein [Anaerolineae bacterium]
MSDVPVELIVAAFQDEKGADQALKELKSAKRQGLIKIENAAVLRKDQKGKLHIKETHDMGGGKGAVLGGVGGAAIGLIAGPALVVPVAVGALVGGLTAKLRDSGFSDKRLETMGEGLTPGSSAIVAVVDHTWVDLVQKEMEEAGADLLTTSLQADIASQLEAGHDVAYSALATQEGFTTSRVAAGEDEVEASEMLVTNEGVYTSQFVATAEGFAVRQMTETDEGVFVEGMVATEDEAVYAAAVETGEGATAVIATATADEESAEESSEESVEKAGDESA